MIRSLASPPIGTCPSVAGSYDVPRAEAEERMVDSSTVTGLVDNVLVLAMACFAVVQLREMNAQSRATAAATRGQVYQALSSAMLDIDRLFVERPELRPYFYDGVDIPCGFDEEQRVLATAELMCDFFDDCTAQAHLLDAASNDVWRNFARGIARTSPAVRAHWLRNGEWYSARLRAAIEDVVLAAEADRSTSEDSVASPA